MLFKQSHWVREPTGLIDGKSELTVSAWQSHKRLDEEICGDPQKWLHRCWATWPEICTLVLRRIVQDIELLKQTWSAVWSRSFLRLLTLILLVSISLEPLYDELIHIMIINGILCWALYAKAPLSDFLQPSLHKAFQVINGIMCLFFNLFKYRQSDAELASSHPKDLTED